MDLSCVYFLFFLNVYQLLHVWFRHDALDYVLYLQPLCYPNIYVYTIIGSFIDNFKLNKYHFSKKKKMGYPLTHIPKFPWYTTTRHYQLITFYATKFLTMKLQYITSSWPSINLYMFSLVMMLIFVAALLS